MSNTDTFGSKLKTIRKKKGLSQQALADKIGVSSVFVGTYENDKRKPKIETIRKFAVALDCSIEELVSDTSIEYSLYKELNYNYGAYELKEYKNSIGVNDEEIKLLKLYRSLNDNGKSKAIEYIKDIMSNPNYSDSIKDIPTI